MDDVKFIKIVFAYGVGQNKRTESFEVEEDMSDQELDEMLNDWILENVNGYWKKENV